MIQKPLATSAARPACSSAIRIVPFAVAAGRAFRFEPSGSVAPKGLAQSLHVHELLWRGEN